ncbi:MAG: aldehyde ferredoxin oxidoreductase C-terminal domain-containing protein, partial [Chloroflexota bacterium]|nr:aldehyde ferredoxin oxidoreductase C-terminal domain-containing protein [Chloroflexota bacterium]
RVDLERLLNALHERVMAWPGRKTLLERGMAELEDGLQQVHCRHRKVMACPSCPVGEKEMVRLEEGSYAGLVTYLPHFNPVELGCRTASEAYGQAVKYLDALNRLGLCRVSFGALLSWLVRLHGEGIITVEDTGGLVPKEDLETALKLMEMVAFRKGFGDILAEGLVGAAEGIGRGSLDYLEHVKGQGMVWDPREKGLGTMEFEEMVNPRGAHVASGGSPSYAAGRPLEDFVRHSERMGATPEAVKRIVGPTSFNPGRLTRYSEDWFSLFNCLGLCNRAHVNRFYSAKLVAELFTAVTGMEVGPGDLMKAAERAWTLGKMLNVRAGFGRKDDRPPEVWFQPLKGPGGERHLTDYYGAPLSRADVERLLDDYYDERGWDKKSGTPTRDKLEELGLPRIPVRGLPVS